MTTCDPSDVFANGKDDGCHLTHCQSTESPRLERHLPPQRSTVLSPAPSTKTIRWACSSRPRETSPLTSSTNTATRRGGKCWTTTFSCGLAGREKQTPLSWETLTPAFRGISGPSRPASAAAERGVGGKGRRRCRPAGGRWSGCYHTPCLERPDRMTMVEADL